MPGRLQRNDVSWAVALSALTIVSRLPYRTRMLYNWDAVQFALALSEYDIAKHQPHPPGYILYVMMGHALNVWLRDATAAYVTLAVIVSGLTTFAVYVLAHSIYGRATAVAAAALLAVSPLFWFYGSVGLTYAAEALAATTVAFFAYRALAGSEPHLYVAALYLGLAGGIRQSILVLLFPLWFGAAVAGVHRTRAIVIGLALIALAALSWFLPMIWLTGGLAPYLEASIDLAELMVKPTVVGTTSLAVTLAQARHLLETIVVGLGPLALAVLALPLYVRRFGWGRREWFLVGWTVPPVLVYTLIHFGQAGYVLIFLPALVILLARVLLGCVSDQARQGPLVAVRYALGVGMVGLVLLVNGSFFVSARPSPRDFEAPPGPWQRRISDEASDWIWSRTAAALHEHEAVVRTFVESIRGLYDPADTAVLTELGNSRSYPWLRHAMFYLPEYPIYQLRVDAEAPEYYAPRLASTMTPTPDSEIRLPTDVRRLVWFVDHWNPTQPRPAGLAEIELPYGRFLYVLALGRRPIDYAGYTFVPDVARRGLRLAR
jgi:Dolichyl-phosphate-mannose-protein mannosyltransferase